MAPNGSKNGSKIAPNAFKWLKMALNRSNWVHKGQMGQEGTARTKWDKQGQAGPGRYKLGQDFLSLLVPYCQWLSLLVLFIVTDDCNLKGHTPLLLAMGGWWQLLWQGCWRVLGLCQGKKVFFRRFFTKKVIYILQDFMTF